MRHYILQNPSRTACPCKSVFPESPFQAGRVSACPPSVPGWILSYTHTSFSSVPLYTSIKNSIAIHIITTHRRHIPVHFMNSHTFFMLHKGSSQTKNKHYDSLHKKTRPPKKSRFCFPLFLFSHHLNPAFMYLLPLRIIDSHQENRSGVSFQCVRIFLPLDLFDGTVCGPVPL